MDEISKGTYVKNAILNCTEVGAAFSLPNIKEKIAEDTGMHYLRDYSEGTFAGCIRDLTKKGILVKVERGIYRRVGAQECLYKENTYETRENTFETRENDHENQENMKNQKVEKQDSFDEIYCDFVIFLQKNKEDLERLIGNVVVRDMKKNDTDRLKRMLAYMEYLNIVEKESREDGAFEGE